MPQNHDIFIFIEVRSSTFEVRVRLVFFEISSRCLKFGHAKVREFEVRIFWVRSNTKTDPFKCGCYNLQQPKLGHKMKMKLQAYFKV